MRYRGELARPRAFTLVELIVVTAITGTLIALLIPAVQSARAASQRTQCANQLRQLGLSLHLYEDAHRALPPGITSPRVGERFPHMSWLTRILPYVEQSGLWRYSTAAYDFQPSPFENPPHLAMSTPIGLFGCPLDLRTKAAQSTHRGRVVALTSYLGVLGTSYEHTDGVLFRDSHVTLGGISDGTSNTLMVGERPPSPDQWFGWWYAGFGQAGTGSCDMLLGVRERNLGSQYLANCPAGPYHFSPGRLDEQCHTFHFWSLHPGGGHFLFADASAHFLRYQADSILPSLATRAGGEIVTAQ